MYRCEVDDPGPSAFGFDQGLVEERRSMVIAVASLGRGQVA